MATPQEQRAVRIDEFLAFLRENLWKPTDLINTPARDLTRAQAIQIIIWLLAWGKFTLRNRDELFVVKSDGTIIVAGTDKKIHVANATIEGVQFRYLTYIDKKGFKKTTVQNMANQDPRMIVFDWKLARMLSLNFNANVIYHIGFIFEASRNDCHGQGRALDFAGAAGPDFDLTVAGDWSGQPVTLQNDYRDPKTGTTLARGTKLPDWPPAPFRDVYFRLDSSINPNLDAAKQYDQAFDLFGQVYDLAADECTDTSDASKSPTRIGPDSSFILHPDYPVSVPGTPHGREAHWQHMHMQVGPTGTETSPP